jgi:hypothetical protein
MISDGKHFLHMPIGHCMSSGKKVYSDFLPISLLELFGFWLS